MSGCAPGLKPRVLERLADADAFGSLGLTRREALWAAKALGRVGDRDDDLPLFVFTASSPRGGASVIAARSGKTRTSVFTGSPAFAGDDSLRVREPDVALPPMPLGEEVVERLPLPAPVAARASGAVPARRS